jgi:DNA-binding Lrp family transcriptional regulator
MQLMLSGFEVSQALYVVAEMGVATALLDGPRSIPALAKEVGADQDALTRIIRFLTPLGVFRRSGCDVEVTDLGRTLAEGPADSVRGMARYWMETHYLPFTGLLHAVRTGEVGATAVLGRPFFDWVNESSHLSELQNSAMSGGGRAARGDLLDSYELPQGDVVADIGGADGTLLVELLAKAPAQKGIVFDLPNIVAEATAILDAAGMNDRVSAVGGDFFESVPQADVYVMSTVLHDWDNASALRILRNVAAASAPGARLVLIEMVLAENDDLHMSNILDVTMLTMLGGRERTATEWRDLLAEGGFATNRIVSGSALFSVIEATLA